MERIVHRVLQPPPTFTPPSFFTGLQGVLHFSLISSVQRTAYYLGALVALALLTLRLFSSTPGPSHALSL